MIMNTWAVFQISSNSSVEKVSPQLQAHFHAQTQTDKAHFVIQRRFISFSIERRNNSVCAELGLTVTVSHIHEVMLQIKPCKARAQNDWASWRSCTDRLSKINWFSGDFYRSVLSTGRVTAACTQIWFRAQSLIWPAPKAPFMKLCPKENHARSHFITYPWTSVAWIDARKTLSKGTVEKRRYPLRFGTR